MGGTKDDATTAAFMAQAMHICTAFDFLCCCFGLCRDGSGRYQKFDEEAAIPYPSSPGTALVGYGASRKQERPPMPTPSGSKRLIPTGSSRGQVKSNRQMFEAGDIKPLNYDPPPTPAPIPLNLLEQMLAAATPAPPAPEAPPAAAAPPATDAPPAEPPAEGAAVPPAGDGAAAPPEGETAAAPPADLAAPPADPAAGPAPAEPAAEAATAPPAEPPAEPAAPTEPAADAAAAPAEALQA